MRDFNIIIVNKSMGVARILFRKGQIRIITFELGDEK